MIPKIIHQTYKDYNLPNIYKDCQEKIKKINPDFEYRFYTDNDMFNYIKVNFPDYYEKFCSLPRMIMKIDMFRYFLMYKDGGIYVDMDYEFFKKIDDELLNNKIILPISREINDDTSCDKTKFGNCIFGSISKHPFWKKVIDTLFIYDRTKCISDMDILINIKSTGPGFLSNMFYQEIENYREDFFLPPRKFFHPDEKKYKIDNDTYGRHLCTANWKNNKM